MALLERAFHGIHSVRQLPLQSTRCLSSSCSRLACSRIQQPLLSETGEVEDKKEDSPSSPKEIHHTLHATPKRGRCRGKISNVCNDTQTDGEDDEIFMQEALCEAQKAAAVGEVPVGAVLVSQGRIIARAHNCVEREKDPTAHAEMVCIRNTARHLGSWRLLDSTLYVTLEPCPMCAGAILQARVGKVVWGTRNPLLGADGSWVSLFPRHALTNNCEHQLVDSVSNSVIQGKGLVHPFNPDIEVRGGVLANDCSKVMKDFFRQRRKDPKRARTTSHSFLSRIIHVIQSAVHMILSFISRWGFYRMVLRQLRWIQRH
ncbi:hypothetical protein KP509_09G061600 [Ceratopteris richardii]|uniref:tRNA(adenine(34)) deaminase n=1 Tax=Ceratopteris richardii TaxID=49495 RepID=A0A8T2UB15_CERRI|nr:hypothetical protein KP509_09G061600 [Ceratopteris richardii]